MDSKNNTTAPYKNEGERVSTPKKTSALDLQPLLGTWKNTSASSQNVKIARFTLENDVLKIQAFGACQPELCDWGKTDCHVFSSNIFSPVVTGLAADYDFGFKKTQIMGNIKLGILVLQIYNTFKDNSGRADYFCREFYYQEKAI